MWQIHRHRVRVRLVTSWLSARVPTAAWVATLAFGFIIAACGPVVAPATVWPKTAQDTTCAEWREQLTPEQRAGLAKGILNGITQPNGAELARQIQADHLSGLLADAISRSCDALGSGRISDIGRLQLRAGANPIYANCEWNSEPRTCDRRP